jgi:transcriptional regulator with XRE-family HTH domain
MFDMVDDGSPARIQERLAGNIRRLRIARHLSLSELARATHIGKATLSSIENGHANPTVGTLSAVAAALRVPVAELLDEPSLGEIRVVRAKPADGVERPIASVPLRASELVLPARHIHEAAAGPAGSREELFVVEGKLIAGPPERITELAGGDYASFPADVARVYETGRQAARALVLRT